MRPRQRRDVIDHRERALLIGLYREPKTVPALERRIGQHARENFEREFEPVGLLRVDDEDEIKRLGEAGEFEQPRREFGEHANARDRFITRMQRRELYGNRRTIPGPRRRANGFDRARVGVEMALGVAGATRRFAQHVEGMAAAVALGALQRRLNRLAIDEVRAHQPHRLLRRGAQRRSAEAAREIGDDGARRLFRRDHARRESEREGAGLRQ